MSPRGTPADSTVELPLLRDYFWMLWARKGSVAAILAIFLGLGLVDFAHQPRSYIASSEVLLRPIARRLGAIEIHEFQELESERLLAGSIPARKRVADRLGGASAPTAVEAPRNGNTLRFISRSSDPSLAQKSANTFAEVYIDYRVELLRNDFRSMSSSLEQFIVKLDEQIASAKVPGQEAQLQSLEAQRAGLQAKVYDLVVPTDIEIGRVIRPAALPAVPASPKTKTVIPLFFMLGAFVSCGQVLLRGWLVPRLHGRRDLAKGLQAPVYALVPESRIRALPTWSAPKSRHGHAYDGLRDVVLDAYQAGALRTLLVTSPGDGEGKSRVATNLAISLARAGRQVVLVSADPAPGAFRRFFGPPSALGGLGSVLTGDAVLHELLSPTFAPGLRVLHSDGSEVTPGLLASARMDQVLASLCSEADLVIVEAPPVLGEATTLALATMSGGVLVVTAADRTKVTALHETRYRLERAGAKVIGAVLNGVDETRFLFDSYAERREFRYADGFETEVPASPDR